MLFSSSECITWLAVTLTVGVAIVTVNLLSVILFIKNRSLRTRPMYLVISLTIVDMFVGGFSHFDLFRLFVNICDIVKMNLSQELDAIIHFLFIWFPLTSLTNIAAISLDRMHATIRPFGHRLIKKWIYGVTIAAVWVLAAMMTAARSIPLLRYRKWHKYAFYVWSSYCCLCLFVICVSYSSIAVKFLCGAHPQHHGAANRQRKLTVTLFIMTIISLLMWVPYTVFVFLSSIFFQSLSFQEYVRLTFSLNILYLMNSLVNPIVYTIRIPKFRKAFLLLFKCQRRQNAQDIPLHAL
ncbi:unnamed protein product [Porites evermanni]|uniref:G-protein coupled receptors family 1 profile domain-containing protein n=1 Tax=Porites evermanni TaxID=104178 RepID=A0ABN8RFE1_9CNID|nr:unnamed protein product [Porites evermanni]